MMRSRSLVCAALGLLALIGCTPTGEGPAFSDAVPATVTPSPRPSATASPTSTAYIPMTPRPTRTPAQDFRVIDAHPETLFLSLEEAGLDDPYFLSYSYENSNEIVLLGQTGETRENTLEWIEETGRVSGWRWTIDVVAGRSGYYLYAALDIHRTSEGARYDMVDAASWPGYLRDLALGDGGYLQYSTSEQQDGEIRHSYSVVFTSKNIAVLMQASGSDPEDLLEWLTDLALMQLSKLQSMPLSDEFVGYW